MKIVAHRGFIQSNNENTSNAVQAASNIGCEFIELDVIMSDDGNMFLSHELYSHRGVYLESCSDEDLIEIHQLTKLNDVLTKHQHITFHLDIKSHQNCVIDNLVSLIYLDNKYTNCILTSFNENHLEKIIELERLHDITIRKGYITNNTHNDNFRNIITKYRVELIILEYSQLKQEIVDEVHKLNAKLSIYTVNDRFMVKICKKIGVDYLVTDYPNSFLPRLILRKLKSK